MSAQELEAAHRRAGNGDRALPRSDRRAQCNKGGGGDILQALTRFQARAHSHNRLICTAECACASIHALVYANDRDDSVLRAPRELIAFASQRGGRSIHEHAIGRRRCAARSDAQNFTGSALFERTFDEGMSLVEETANYLDGKGREESRDLPRKIAMLYAGESMRVTTRLMQAASWLLVQRAVHDGDMEAGRCDERALSSGLEGNLPRRRQRRRRTVAGQAARSAGAQRQSLSPHRAAGRCAVRAAAATGRRRQGASRTVSNSASAATAHSNPRQSLLVFACYGLQRRRTHDRGRKDRDPEQRAAFGKVEHRCVGSRAARRRLDEHRRRRVRPGDHADALSSRHRTSACGLDPATQCARVGERLKTLSDARTRVC